MGDANAEQEDCQMAMALEASLRDMSADTRWDCDFCTFANNRSRRDCAMCSASAPAAHLAMLDREHVPAAAAPPAAPPAAAAAPLPPLVPGQRDGVRFEVPNAEGTLQCRVMAAHGLTSRARAGKMSPYVEMRVLQKSYVGPLTLVVHEARGLRKVQLIGKADPYVRMRLAKKSWRSWTHKNGATAPSWNDRALFNLEGCEEERLLSVEVWNDNTIGSDDLMGKLLLSLPQVVKAAGLGPVWHKLVVPRKKGADKEAGELLLTVEHSSELRPHQYNVLYKQRTVPCKGGGTSPVWEAESSVFKRLTTDVAVHFIVWHRTTVGSDRFVGQTETIPIKNALLQSYFSRGQNTWYPLGPRPRAGKKKVETVTGSLRLLISFVNEEFPFGVVPEAVGPGRGDADAAAAAAAAAVAAATAAAAAAGGQPNPRARLDRHNSAPVPAAPPMQHRPAYPRLGSDVGPRAAAAGGAGVAPPGGPMAPGGPQVDGPYARPPPVAPHAMDTPDNAQAVEGSGDRRSKGAPEPGEDGTYSRNTEPSAPPRDY